MKNKEKQFNKLLCGIDMRNSVVLHNIYILNR